MTRQPGLMPVLLPALSLLITAGLVAAASVDSSAGRTIAESSADVAGTAPRLVLTPLTELGVSSPEVVVPGRLVAVNTGPETITIDRITGTCGCIRIVEETPIAVDPGRSASIAFTMKAPASGEKTKPIHLALDDGSTVTTRVHLATDDGSASRERPADRALVAVPSTIDLGLVPAAIPVERTIWLANTGSATRSVPTIKGSCACLTVVGDPSAALAAIEPGAAVAVTVRLEPPADPGRRKSVSIMVAADDGSTLTVPIRCTATVPR